MAKTPTTKEFVDELREKFPRMGMNVDYGKSRSSAINLFCRACIQAASAAQCPSVNCPLFLFRPGADSPDAKQRKPGDVPSQEQYEEWLRLRDPDGSKADAARERFMRTMAEDEEA